MNNITKFLLFFIVGVVIPTVLYKMFDIGTTEIYATGIAASIYVWNKYFNKNTNV